jgi:hypothetical protein
VTARILTLPDLNWIKKVLHKNYLFFARGTSYRKYPHSWCQTSRELRWGSPRDIYVKKVLRGAENDHRLLGFDDIL